MTFRAAPATSVTIVQLHTDKTPVNLIWNVTYFCAIMKLKKKWHILHEYCLYYFIKTNKKKDLQDFVLGKAQYPLQTAKQWEILHTLRSCNHANCVTEFLHCQIYVDGIQCFSILPLVALFFFPAHYTILQLISELGKLEQG